MANAFARYLPCFETEPPPAPFDFDEPPPAPQIEIEPDPVDPVAEAEQRGRESGRAEAWAEFELIRAEDAARAEQQLAEARQSWTEGESDRLSEQFRLAFDDLETRIAAEVAEILAGFVAASVREQAVSDMAGMLKGLLQDGKHGSVRVSGPEDLLKAIRLRLGESAASVAFAADGSLEAQAVLDDTILRTQLGAWRDRLTAAVD